MTVVLNEAGLFALLESPTGPVAQDVLRRAETVAQFSRENVQAQFRSRSGNLLASIDTFPSESADGLQVEVGTDGAPYGRLLETGSPAHGIAAVNAPVLFSEPGHPDPLLRAQRFVNHPGGVPRPWLVPALRDGIGV